MIGALGAVPLLAGTDDKENEIIADLELVIRKHKLSVPARTAAPVLARYLYQSMILFSQFSEMRDRSTT